VLAALHLEQDGGEQALGWISGRAEASVAGPQQREKGERELMHGAGDAARQVVGLQAPVDGTPLVGTVIEGSGAEAHSPGAADGTGRIV
jgi:hypothetical protein